MSGILTARAPFYGGSKCRASAGPTTQNYALRRKPCTNCIERGRLDPHETLETRFRECCLSKVVLREQEAAGSNPVTPTLLGTSNAPVGCGFQPQRAGAFAFLAAVGLTRPSPLGRVRF